MDASASLPALAGISLVLLIILKFRSIAAWNDRSRGLPLPPGPKPLPIIGNMLDFPRAGQRAAFRAMCAKYGDMIHFDLLGKHVLVVGDSDAIVELLEKRSANTSDRTLSPLAVFTCADKLFSLSPYNDGWRSRKRGFWQYFNPNALSAYDSLQCKHAYMFLHQLVVAPSQLKELIRFTLSAAIWEVLLGDRMNDKKMAMVHEALDWIGPELGPGGRYLVEGLPFLRYVPTWFPGAATQRSISRWRSTFLHLREELYREAKVALVETNDAPEGVIGGLITTMLQKDEAAEAEDVIKDIAITAIEGASDTVFSSMQSFFLAMALYPDVQKRAQAELDAVVGSHRLPDFGDQESLVYLSAVIRETSRWQSVVPFSVAHTTLRDDEFRGYFLPAGTIILPIISAFTRNRELYEDPDEFRPERFIRNGKLDFTTAPDPTSYVFGFGRRTCPGRYFAQRELFIYAASVLHVLNITPPVDDNGVPVAIREGMTDGLVSYPVDCRCTIKPRSPEAEALMRKAQSLYHDD